MGLVNHSHPFDQFHPPFALMASSPQSTRCRAKTYPQAGKYTPILALISPTPVQHSHCRRQQLPHPQVSLRLGLDSPPPALGRPAPARTRRGLPPREQGSAYRTRPGGCYHTPSTGRYSRTYGLSRQRGTDIGLLLSVSPWAYFSRVDVAESSASHDGFAWAPVSGRRGRGRRAFPPTSGPPRTGRSGPGHGRQGTGGLCGPEIRGIVSPVVPSAWPSVDPPPYEIGGERTCP
jgi:hypothetical protein